MSLYLKYRPQNFATLVGQAHATKTIQNALQNDSLSHAYLFCGPRGTGKTSLARIVAKALNCQNRSGAEPCNECSICTSINAGKLVDLIEIDAASNRGIDEIRELREKIVFSPSQAKTKVYIIDEVHMLTKEAFNALLKTLEEPPSHAYFILATTEAHKIPETIISRCQQFTFGRIELGDISKRLEEVANEEGATYEKEALDLIARLSAGGLRDAIGLLEQMIASGGEVTAQKVTESLGLTGDDHLKKFLSYLLEKKPLKAVELLNQIKSKGGSIPQFLKELMGIFREQMLINLGNSKDTKLMVGFIEIFTEAGHLIDLSPIPELPIEMAIIKACDYEVELPESKKAEEPIQEAVKKEVKEVAVARVIPEEALGFSGDLNFERIKKDWYRLLEAVTTPFIQMSLRDGEPMSYEAGILTIAFKSSTYMEKVASTPNQAVIQEAFVKVFGSKIDLKLEMKKIELTPMVKKNDSTETPGGPISSVVDMAAEVFGIK